MPIMYVIIMFKQEHCHHCKNQNAGKFENNTTQTCRTILYHVWLGYTLLVINSSSWAQKGSGSRIPFNSKASRKKKNTRKQMKLVIYFRDYSFKRPPPPPVPWPQFFRTSLCYNYKSVLCFSLQKFNASVSTFRFTFTQLFLLFHFLSFPSVSITL